MKHYRFGVELEFSTHKLPIYQSVKDILPITLNLDLKSDGRTWDLKSDYSTLCELVSPILNIKSPQYKLLQQAIKKLEKSDNIKVSEKDGFHVHVHHPEWTVHDKDKILLAWLAYEEIITQLFPYHRTKLKEVGKNYSAKYIPHKIRKNTKLADIFNKCEKYTNVHYMALSFMYWKRRRSIEFRIHEGVKNWEDVSNWILFCLTFSEAAKNMNSIKKLCNPYKSPNIKELLTFLHIKNSSLKKWIVKRYNLYKRS